MAKGLQSYYTKQFLANEIGHIASKVFSFGRTHFRVLDIGAGSANLSSGIRINLDQAQKSAWRFNIVEPQDTKVPRWINRAYRMTLEEYAMTYGNERYELVIANPPFGKRAGTTEIGEQVTDFYPQVERFESLFMLIGSELTTQMMVIVPTSYLTSSEWREYTAKELQMRGMFIYEIVSLPVDGFHDTGAIDTCVIFLRKAMTETRSFSRAPFTNARFRNAVYVDGQYFVSDNEVNPNLNESEWFLENVEGRLVLYGLRASNKFLKEYSGNFGHTFTGYSSKDMKPFLKEGTSQVYHVPRAYIFPIRITGYGDTYVLNTRGSRYAVSLNDSGMALEHSPLQQLSKSASLGELWERNGFMYELFPYGWDLAESQGYSNGVPTTKAYRAAKKAFELFNAGAVQTAAFFIKNLNINKLAEKYGSIASASFLNVLDNLSLKSNNSSIKDALLADIERAGGALEVGGLVSDESAENLGIIKLKGFLVHPNRDKWEPGSISQVFSKYTELFSISTAGLSLKDSLSDSTDNWNSTANSSYLERVVNDDYPIVREIIEYLANALELGELNVPFEDSIKFRSEWIQKEYFIEKYNMAFSGNGFLMALGRGYNRNNEALATWLNYGSNGSRITDSVTYIVNDMLGSFRQAIVDTFTLPSITGLLLLASYNGMRYKNDNKGAFETIGIKPALKLHDYQEKAFEWARRGYGIFEWDVGVGKTPAALAVAASDFRITLAVVPLKTVENWEREQQRFFPNMSCEILGFRRNSKGRLIRIPNRDLDKEFARVFFEVKPRLVITSHEVFAYGAPPSKRDFEITMQNVAHERITGESISAENRRAYYVQTAATKRLATGGAITWTDLPLANMRLIVDEAHRFKGTDKMPTTGWGTKLIMSGQTSESKRATDMFVRAKILMQHGGHILGLTATPVRNAPVEAFNMLSIFADPALKKFKVFSPKSYIDNFATFEHTKSVSFLGEYVEGRKISGFTNLDIHRELWSLASWTLHVEDVKLDLPKANEIMVHIEPDIELRSIFFSIRREIDEAVKDGAEDPPHIFTILHKLDEATNTPDLMDYGYVGNPKVDRICENVVVEYEKGGKQVVFADRTAMHDAIENKLVSLGIPREQIAVLNSKRVSGTTAQRKVEERFNSGDIRVIIGGAMISEGINLQIETTAIHYAQLPWEGKTLTQREGRVVRQGNTIESVNVYYYIMSHSIDPYRWATIQTKTHWFEALQRSKGTSVEATVMSSPVDMDLLSTLVVDSEKVGAILRENALVGAVKKFQKELRKALVKIYNLKNPYAPKSKDHDTKLEFAIHHLRNLCHKHEGLADTLLDLVDRLGNAVNEIIKKYGEDRDLKTKLKTKRDKATFWRSVNLGYYQRPRINYWTPIYKINADTSLNGLSFSISDELELIFRHSYTGEKTNTKVVYEFEEENLMN